jgi:effector-binding domain-containing protein
MTEANPEKTPEIKSAELHEQPTAVVRETVPVTGLREFFGRAYGAVLGAVRQQHAQLSGPPFALYRGTPSDVVDVEAGFPLDAPLPGAGDGGVTAGSLPAGPAYEALHIGPYEDLEKTYQALIARMAAEAVAPAEEMWEYYLSDPGTEPDPARWKTLVVWPVA